MYFWFTFSKMGFVSTKDKDSLERSAHKGDKLRKYKDEKHDVMLLCCEQLVTFLISY